MEFSSSQPLVIGTRGSPLALFQANATRDALVAVGLAPEAVVIREIRTSGDRIQDRSLSESGGKGLFTKEIDEAQLAGAVHIAVHSAKDLPTRLPEGLVIAGYLPREDARDALICVKAASLQALPPGARVGSASLRRQALIRRLRPDLEVTLLRGNVGTRLEKVKNGELDATILALAGLKRLGLAGETAAILPVDEFIPAVGQGAIALVIRAGDGQTRRHTERIVDAATGICVSAERAFLDVLDGSCRTPIAGHATLENGRVRLDALVLKPDGSAAFAACESADAAAAEALGRQLGETLKARLPSNFFGA